MKKWYVYLLIVLMCTGCGATIPDITDILDKTEDGITFTVQTEKYVVVDSAKIRILLTNCGGDDDGNSLCIAESTSGKVKYKVQYDEEKNVLIYDGKEYSYLRVQIDLPDGYITYDGENKHEIIYDAENSSSNTTFHVEDLSDGDNRSEWYD